jgi:energy-coupling factor transporter ATP-binding protein EcfA2
MFVSSTGAAKSAADTDRIYREWLRQTPLASRVETPPLALSGGQQRLLMLEAVVASCPAHIVIDGGMDVFDKAFQQRAAAVVRQWLDDNPQRTLVYFSLPKASEWMEFGDKLVLRSTAPPGESLPSKSTMRASVAKNVVAYRHVAAGPIIDKHPLLKNIELHVKEGEFVALHGANGVGKSTLLRLLAGVVRIRRGRIEFGGRSLSRVRWPGLRGGVGYLPQEPEMAGPYAIRDGGFQGMKRESSTQWNEWNAYLGLKWNGDWGDYWVMSSGQRAQAALLVQLVRQPRFWMFDEPTVRLGAESVLDMFAKLRSAQPLLAAIVVSHNNAFLRAACDRHVELTPNGIAPVYS